MNPFVALFRDPVFTLAAIGYAFLLLALSVGFLAALVLAVTKGWSHIVWLGNAWEWRGNAQQFGPEWDLSLPPDPVVMHTAKAFGYLAMTAFFAALWFWALGGAVWVLGQI